MISLTVTKSNMQSTPIKGNLGELDKAAFSCILKSELIRVCFLDSQLRGFAETMGCKAGSLQTTRVSIRLGSPAPARPARPGPSTINGTGTAWPMLGCARARPGSQAGGPCTARHESPAQPDKACRAAASSHAVMQLFSAVTKINK